MWLRNDPRRTKRPEESAAISPNCVGSSAAFLSRRQGVRICQEITCALLTQYLTVHTRCTLTQTILPHSNINLATLRIPLYHSDQSSSPSQKIPVQHIRALSHIHLVQNNTNSWHNPHRHRMRPGISHMDFFDHTYYHLTVRWHSPRIMDHSSSSALAHQVLNNQ